MSEFVIKNETLVKYNGREKNIEIPEEVVIIGNAAFIDCDFIESVIITPAVQLIGDRAFYGCSALKKVVIPEGVTTIGDCAFGNCENLEEIEIPKKITSIDDNFLNNNSGVKRINISNIEAWMNIDFQTSASNPLTYAHNLYLNGAPVTDLVIPSSVEIIDAFAFMGCHTLRTVTISPGVKRIKGSAFSECINLVSVDIPESVTRIDWGAFKDCCSLIINVPDTVKHIGVGAFSGVKHREDLVFHSVEESVSLDEYDDIRPTLLTICDEPDADVHTDDIEPVYLFSKFYEKEVFEQILTEATEWYITSYHSEGSDYGYSSSYSNDSEDYYEIPYNKIVVENGHFAGIAEVSNFSAYMKRGSYDNNIKVALIKNWEGKPIEYVRSGQYFGSDDHSSWDTTTHYLCKK